MSVLKEKKYWIILAIFIELVWATFWCGQKEGLFVDGGFTYVLSNSDMNPFFYDDENYVNTWNDISYYTDAMTVQPNERFAIKSVRYNQSQDVHPPFYYFIINAISSIFPNTFSMWIGLIPNLIFFAVILVFLYLILLESTGNHVYALIGQAVYGLSVGAIANVMLIRMYVLLAMLVTISTYLHLKLLKCPDKHALYYKLIWFITLVGALTQYYYVIFHALITIFVMAFLLYKKEIRKVIDMAIGYIVLLAIYIMMWPDFFRQLFNKAETSGNRGAEVLSNIMGSTLFIRATAGGKLLSGELSQGIILITVILLVGLIIVFVQKKAQINGKLEITLLGFVSMIYIILVLKIAPDMIIDKWALGTRYWWPIYPVFIVFIMTAIWIVFKSKKMRVIVTSALIVLTVINYWDGSSTLNILKYQQTANIVEAIKGEKKAVVVTDFYQIYSLVDVLTLSDVQKVKCIAPKNLEEYLESDEAHDEMVFIFTNQVPEYYSLDSGENISSFESGMLDKHGIDNIQYIDNKAGNDVYIINK